MIALVSFGSINSISAIANDNTNLSANREVDDEAVISDKPCLSNTIDSISHQEYNLRNPAGNKIVRQGAAYDLIDKDDHVIVNKIYAIEPLEDYRLIARRRGKQGVIGQDGEVILGFDYQDIILTPDTSVYVVENRHNNIQSMALIDNKGKWIYPQPTANQSAKELSREIEAIYPAHTDAKTNTTYFLVTTTNYANSIPNIKNEGVIDNSGKSIVPIEYYDIDWKVNCTTNNIVFFTRQANTIGIIDKNGKFILPNVDLQSFNYFNQNKSLFKIERFEPNPSIAPYDFAKRVLQSTQVITDQGEVLVTSDGHIELVGSLYSFEVAGKIGFIDSGANIIIEPKFDSFRPAGIGSDLIIVQKNNKKAVLTYDEQRTSLTASKYYDDISSELYIDPLTIEQLKARSALINPKTKSTQNNSSQVESVKAVESEMKSTFLPYNEVTTNFGYTYDANAIFVFTKDGKQGLMTAHGRVLIPNKYDEIMGYDHFLQVRQGKKYGLVTALGETILPIEYDAINETGNHYQDGDLILFMVEKDGQQGVLDEFGQVMLPLSAIHIPNILNTSLEDLLLIQKEGLYGLIELPSAKQILPAEFEHINFKHYKDFIVAQKDGHYELFDKQGHKIYAADDSIVDIAILNSRIELHDPFNFTPTLFVKPTTDFISIINSEGAMGLVSMTGQEVLPAKFNSIHYAGIASSVDDLKNQRITPLFTVEQDDKFGLVDATGKMLISPQYHILNTFHYPPYFVTINFDEEVTENDPVAINASEESEDLAEDIQKVVPKLNLSSSGLKMGVIDMSAKEILPPDYNLIMPTFNGAAVQIYAIKEETAYKYNEKMQLISTQPTSELEQLLEQSWESP